jgi:RNA polymerase sigma-70 factor (ECF subfamily)
MERHNNHLDLVRQAQIGNRQSIESLTNLVRPKVFTYIYRITLEQDLAEDLCQQVLLEMLKSLKRLKFDHENQFWAWLFRTAQGKVQQHYRKQHKKKVMLMSATKEHLSQRAQEQKNDGLSELIRKELSLVVSKAMAQLKIRHRSILTLRCYEQMPYSQIADIVGCSELNARSMFFQAKQALKKQLKRSGFSKTMLLTALGLFGRITSPTKASTGGTAISAASVQVGITGTIVGATATKLGVTVATAVTAASFMIGGVALSDSDKLPQRNMVKSSYYIEQSPKAAPGDLAASSSLSKGAYEKWYYYPDGVDGPAFMRMQRWNPQMSEKQCAWLQNAEGKYYYFAGEPPALHINNYNIWRSSLSTIRLPVDSPELTQFLDEVEGRIKRVTYTRDPRTKLMRNRLDRRFVDVRNYQTLYKYNTLDEKFFDYDWPLDVTVKDNRDPMHVRGWTYFVVTGKIGNDKIEGYGQLPFIYDQIEQHPPMLKLKIANKLQIIDMPSGAYIQSPDGDLIAGYPQGTFFEGLARPWMGMHTVDLVRRDAAKRRIFFETKAISEEQVRVTLSENYGTKNTNLTYHILMENDLIDKIIFSTYIGSRLQSKGTLTFDYISRLEQAEPFAKPQIIADEQPPHRKAPEVSWLMELAKGTLLQQPSHTPPLAALQTNP